MFLPTKKSRIALALGLVCITSSPAFADRIKNPLALFAGLDKITGRIITFEVAIDETVQFGTLQVTPKICYTRPPTEAPQTDAFVDVTELTSTKEYNKLFSGWMFAASPGLHGVEHAVYDVWLTDCKGGKTVIANPVEPVATPDAPPPPAPGTVPKKKTTAPQPLAPTQLAPAGNAPADIGGGDGAPINVGPAPGAKAPAEPAVKKPKSTRKIVPVDPPPELDLNGLDPIPN